MGAANAPAPGSYRSLRKNQQRKITEWLEQLQNACHGLSEQPPKVGLWVNGVRRSGTTYAASVAVKRAVRAQDRAKYGTVDWEYVTAAEWDGIMRWNWSTLRQGDDDINLTLEAARFRHYLEWLDEVDLLWIDDITLGATDPNFFFKHQFNKIEQRIKAKRATVVSTSFGTNQLGLMASVIRDLFIICDCGDEQWSTGT